MTIVRVTKFGGSRTLDPPGWGILEANADLTSDVLMFYVPQNPMWEGDWFLDPGQPGSFWTVPEDEVPDEVWAALAKWRLLHGDTRRAV